MKKRLLAFVLVCALLGGFAQSFSQANPASAQGLCPPGYTEGFADPEITTTNKDSTIVKSKVALVAGICYNGTIVTVNAVFAAVLVTNGWIFDNAYFNYAIEQQGNAASVGYNLRWEKWNGSTFKGYACMRVVVLIYPQGHFATFVPYYDRDC